MCCSINALPSSWFLLLFPQNDIRFLKHAWKDLYFDKLLRDRNCCKYLGTYYLPTSQIHVKPMPVEVLRPKYKLPVNSYTIE